MAQAYPGLEWEISTPEAEGMDPAKFAAAMAKMPARGSVVIRHGKIVGMKGDVTRPGPLYSASKSLLAVLAGTAMHGGLIHLDTLMPGSDNPEPPLATLREFLSMTADFRLTPHSPGNHYAYSNSGAIHYGRHLLSRFYPGRTATDALREACLDKLQLQDPLSLIGAISGWGGGGFVISTRDFARVGYLVLRHGDWNGEQLLPPDFVDSLYVSQIPPQATLGGAGTGEVDNQIDVAMRMPGSYSFGFWMPHGAKGYAGVRSQNVAATASGSFGTSMHVVRDHDLVLAAVNSITEYTGGKISSSLLDEFVAAIVAQPPPGGDTTPPTVSLTSPSQGATVSGTVSVSALASDNVAVAGVQFRVDGVAIGAEDVVSPYAVSWNTASVSNAAHTVTAVARDGAGNTQSASVTVTVNNPVAGQAVSSFVLINADTDQPIGPIGTGAVINLAATPRVNIHAVTNPATVGSVRFILNGAIFRTENAAPYALAGDTSGNYAAWTPAPGSYTLTATPFTGANASGTAGTPLTIQFTVQ